MKRLRMEVCPRNDAVKPWKVTLDGKSLGTHLTQHEAIDAAVDEAHRLADEGEIVTLRIKGRNGRIRDDRTYPRSSDPRSTKG